MSEKNYVLWNVLSKAFIGSLRDHISLLIKRSRQNTIRGLSCFDDYIHQ